MFSFLARSIRNYEYWLTSFIPLLDLSKSSLPPRFHLYGKQLAILEAAKYSNNPLENEFINELERKLVAYHTDWSVSNSLFRGLRRETRRVGWMRGHGPFVRWMGRCVGAILGGGCMLAPVCILVLWPGGVSQAGGVGVVGVSVGIVGMILAWGLDGEQEKKRGWEGIEGARDKERYRSAEWRMMDVILVLAAYAAVLVLFLGAAIV